MSGNEYIQSTLNRYKVSTGNGSAAYKAGNALYTIIQTWAGTQLQKVSFSGSYAKGTAIRGNTDVDLFISLKSDTTNTLKDIFKLLYDEMKRQGYNPRKQHVSIHVNGSGVDVDLVPGVNYSGNTAYHWLYVNKPNRERVQTNIDKHINIVRNSGRNDEIRAMKIWKNVHGLEFPSFYLELVVIEALRGWRTGQIATNVMHVLGYLANNFLNTRFVDPANSNNIISGDLTTGEKRVIVEKANESLEKQYWKDIIW